MSEKDRIIKEEVEKLEKENEQNSLGTAQIPSEKLNDERRLELRQKIAESGFVPTNSLQKRNTNLKHVTIQPLDLPTKSKFYPVDVKIQIRAAEIEEIEHFSMIHDHNPMDVDAHIYDIIRSCCIMSSETHPDLNSMDLCEGDKMYVVLAIKDLTFPESENVINYDIECHKCGHINKRELGTSIISVNGELEPEYEKYYSEEERCYIFKTKSYGDIRMRPPRIGVIEYVYNKTQTKVKEKKYWDKTFHMMFPFIFDESRCSGPILDTAFDEMYAKYKSNRDPKKFSLLYRFAEMMQIGVKPNIDIICSNIECKEGIQIPFRIPGGSKSLFVISDISSELV